MKGGDNMSKSPPNRIKIKAQCPDEDRLEEFINLIRNMYGRKVRGITRQNKSKRGEYRVMMHVYLEVP